MLLKCFTGQKHPIQYPRSREYRKNDNAHIEEKNWTHVRQFIGYQRFDKPETVEMLNDLYLNEWKFYLNFFIPAFKLMEKKRDGSKIIKKFSSPLTPYHRLLASEQISLTKKKQLTKIFNSLDPFTLEKKMKNILKFY